MASQLPEDRERTKRKRRGIRLGVVGLILLFGSGLSIRLVPGGWEVLMLALMGVATAIIVYSYILVR